MKPDIKTSGTADRDGEQTPRQEREEKDIAPTEPDPAEGSDASPPPRPGSPKG